MRYLKYIFVSLFAVILLAFIVYLIVLRLHYAPVILQYHRIEVGHRNEEKLTVSQKAFDRQMEFLYKNKYNVVSLAQMVEYINNHKKIPPKTVAITFDDGTFDNFDYAFPVLKKYNFPAAIFMISDCVNKKPAYLSLEELKILSENNITIGSHTKTHRRLVEADKEELLIEVKESKAELEKMLGRKVEFISYPFGAFNENVLKAVKEAGYKGGCAVSPGRKFSDWNVYALKRIRVSPSADNLFVFAVICSGYYNFIKEMRDSD